MKVTITLADRYNENITCNVRVEAIELDEQSATSYSETHYAKLTINQIAKISRELPNGCKSVNDTHIDNMGRVDSAEIYFSVN